MNTFSSAIPEYHAWRNMLNRCYIKRNPNFQDYGARGIQVCEEWRKAFHAFLRDVGRRPSRKYSLHRIDNDGPYAPGNVKWATASEQAANRRNKERERGAARRSRRAGLKLDPLVTFKVRIPESMVQSLRRAARNCGRPAVDIVRVGVESELNRIASQEGK